MKASHQATIDFTIASLLLGRYVVRVSRRRCTVCFQELFRSSAEQDVCVFVPLSPSFFVAGSEIDFFEKIDAHGFMILFASGLFSGRERESQAITISRGEREFALG